MSEPRRGFLSHPLNLLLLASAGISAVWVQDARPLLVGAMAEGVWLVLGPWLRRRERAAARRMQVDDGEQVQVRALTEPLRRRFLDLGRIRGDIRRLAEANADLEKVGIERELSKVDALVSGWLRLAVRTAQMQSVVEENAIEDLEAELGANVTDSRRSTAQSRLAEARLARTSLAESEQELFRVEEALRMVRDRVVSVATPDSLAEPLDALLDGVDAAERAVRALQRLESVGASRPGS